MSGEATSTGANQLVEHFFRHESAKLIAVLTRAFGLARLDLVEDKVQESMLAATEACRYREAYSAALTAAPGAKGRR